jgi:hypothetical protein
MMLIYVKRFTILHTIAACLCLAALGWSPLSVRAEVFNGQAGTTDYNDPNNWENDTLPGTLPDTDAVIGQEGVSDPDAGGDGFPFLNPAVVTLDATPSPANLRDLIIGDGENGNGTLNHSAGTLTTGSTNWTFLGRDGTSDNPAMCTYNLSGTAVFSGTGVLILGADGGGGPGPNYAKEGHITVADSAELFTNALDLGRSDNALGQLEQTGGLVSVNDWAAFGENDTTAGHYNISGGTFEVLNDGLAVGQRGVGSLNVSGSATVDLTNLRVGRNAGGVGLVSITGDQVSFIADVLTVGGEDGTFTGGQGTLRFTSASSVSPIEVFTDVFLNDGSLLDGDFDMDGNVNGADFLVWQKGDSPDGGTPGDLTLWETDYGMESGAASLEVDLTTNPPPAGDVLLIDNQGFNAVDGAFAGLPEGAVVPNSGGRTISYTFGDGNDIGLILPSLSASASVPEPSSALLVLIGVFCLKRTRLDRCKLVGA